MYSLFYSILIKAMKSKENEKMPSHVKRTISCGSFYYSLSVKPNPFFSETFQFSFAEIDLIFILFCMASYRVANS